MPARQRYVVGARKIPPADRDVAAAVFADPGAGYWDVIGSDDDPAVPLGAPVAYVAHLTDTEAEQFRDASNCRYVELDERHTADQVGDPEPDRVTANAAGIPSAATLAYMGAAFGTATDWHGRDVLVAILDGGTSPQVRTVMGWTVVAELNFTDVDPGADGITTNHGCLVAPNGVPEGGRILDAIIADNEGSAFTSDAAAAMRWAADNGAKVVNYSYSGTSPSSVTEDAIVYLRARGVQLYCSAGNDSAYRLNYPAAYSRVYENVHSSIAFDETTDLRGSFSNHHEDGSGCAPGVNVLSLDPAGTVVTWSGTSASSPHMALLCARGMTGGRFTASQVAAALDTTTRDTPEPPAEEGHGAYHLEQALTSLGAFEAPAPPGPVVTYVQTAAMSPLARQLPYAPASAAVLNTYAAEIERVAAGSFGDLDNLARPVVRVRRTGSFFTSSGIDTAVTFQAEDDDPDGMWSTAATNRVIIRTPGLWLFTSQVRWERNSAGTRASKIMLNGTNPLTAGVSISSGKTPGQGDGEGNTIQLAAFRRFALNDAIYLNQWQNSGISLESLNDFGGIYLSGVWLGP